ncbi:MAG: glutamate--tRNA ligase [Candidatus Taylorbacteria bacterium]
MSLEKRSNPFITRFPPSPTGFLQMGNVRTAIYNYLLARKNGGQFLLRIEDTDRERSTREFETALLENLKWLGLTWDNAEVPRQSERNDVYKGYLQKLVKEGKAYVSKEDTKGDATKRAEVIRFKNPNTRVVFADMIRGQIEFDTTELGDFVIAKSMDEPIYHLAVVVDDFESKVTHIVRGEDHISNTPRQILIQEAIGAPRPIYAHLPLILDRERAKLSKRKHGEKVSLRHFEKEGYLPVAIVNYMAMLGWNPGGDNEIFSLSELIPIFDITKVQKGGAIFDEEKLRWFNKEHLKKISNYQSLISKEIKKVLGEVDDEIVEKIAPIVFERISTFGDIKKMNEEGELAYFFGSPEYDSSKLSWKDESKEKTKGHLESVLALIQKAPEKDFTEAGIKNAIWKYAEEAGKGSVLWPLRFALSGREKSPDPFTLAFILGKEETEKRLETAIKKLS